MIEGITISVKNPRVYHALIVELKSKGYKLVNDGEIVVTDSDEKGTQATLIVKEGDDIMDVVGKVAVISRGKERFNELLIGVDTNPPSATVAIIGDGELIDYYTRVDKNFLCHLIRKALKIYPHRRYVIGIGTGNMFGYEILRSIKPYFPEAKKVNEFRTSSRTNFNRIKDSDLRAAYTIAMRASRQT